MKRLHLVLLVCVALMPAMPVSTAQTPDSDAPYLYYYSERLNAYVIERADGTDSRIFGEGILDPDTDYLTGPGWSPSGEWFAVKADNRWNPEHKHSSMILNVNGEERMILFDEIDIRWMEWARTVDILIASTAQWNEVRQTLDVTYFLVDVNNNQVIREFTFATDSNYTYQLTWLSNPDQFVISYTNPIEQADSFIISTIHGEFTGSNGICGGYRYAGRKWQ